MCTSISKKVLADTLKALERDGMLTRVTRDEGHHTYELTALGSTLQEPLTALQIWPQSHVDEVLAAQDLYDLQQDCDLLPASALRAATDTAARGASE